MEREISTNGGELRLKVKLFWKRKPMILRRECGRSQRRKIIYKFCQKNTVFVPKSTWFVQSLPKSGITYNIPLMKLRWLLAERFSCPKRNPSIKWMPGL